MLPPGPREPAALQTLEWVARPTALLRRCERRFGSVFTLRLRFDDAPTVVLSDPEAIRAVFAAPDIARRSGSPGPLAPVVGPRSITALDGAAHLRARRLLLAPFHGEALARLTPALEGLADRHLAALPVGRPVALLPRFAALTLDAILRVVLGAADPVLAAHARAALDHVRALPRALALALSDAGSPVWRPFLARVDAVEARVTEVVRARRAAGAEGDDVLATLLRAGCDDDEVRDHVLTLVAAGHDTTAAALAWCAERLARADPQGTVTSRSRESGVTAPLVSPSAFVREVLRTRPPLTVAPRRLAAPMRLAGFDVPAGVHVAPCAYLAGRRGDVWIPFGGGTRRCTGAAFAELELATAVRVLDERFTVRPEPGHERGERARRRGVTLTPARGARVVLEAR